MTDKDTGGPAFPGSDWVNVPDCENPNAPPYKQVEYGPGSGMTLRDWFAGQALDLIPFDSYDHAASSVGAVTGAPLTEHQHAQLMARRAYLVADALIAERAK